MMKLRLLLIFFAIASVAWGQTDSDTLNCPAGTISNDEMVFTTDNFTIIHAKGTDSNHASYSPWRVYTNNTVTFTGGENVQKITSIVITATSNNYARDAVGNNSILTVLSGTGTVSGSYNNTIVTLSVTGDDVTAIRLKPHAQTRWSSITINYEAAPSCETPTFGFAESIVNKLTNDESFTNAFTSDNTSAMIWSSTDTNVATVNANGEVSIVGAGTTEIQVNQAADNTYCAVEATYTLNVVAISYDITAIPNNENFGTVSLSGNVITATPAVGYTYATPAYTVVAGAATVVQDGDEFTVTPTENSTIQINFEAKPTYTLSLFNDGSAYTEGDFPFTTYEGNTISLPTLENCGIYTFVGWDTNSSTTSAPTYTGGETYTITNANVNLYAVYSETIEGGGTTTSTFGFEDGETGWTSTATRSTTNPKSGSYSGFINGNHTHTTFDNLVASPVSITFSLRRTSNNTNYNVQVQTSPDNSNWTTIETYPMSDFSNGSYTEKTTDLSEYSNVYVRVYVYNTTAQRYIDDFSITYGGGSTTVYTTDPSCDATQLIVSETELSGFVYAVGSGPSDSQSFVVSGLNLDGSEDVTLIADTDFEISLDDTTFEDDLSLIAYEGEDTTIYVRLKAGLSTNTYEGIILIDGYGVEQEVEVSGSVLALPVITEADDLTAQVGVEYSYQIMATDEPFSYVISSDVLPTGLSLEEETGLISGTPSIAGEFIFGVTVENAVGESEEGIFILTVAKGTQILDDFADATKYNTDAPFDLPETTQAGLTVSYESSNTAVATIDGNTVSIAGLGTTNITATQAGNDNWNALEQTITLTVTEAPVGPCFAEQAVNQSIFTRSGSTTTGGGTPATHIRLGAGSASGTLTTSSLAGVSGNVTFRAEVRGWNSNEKIFYVNLGGVQGVGTILNSFNNSDSDTTTFEWVEIELANVPANPILEIMAEGGNGTGRITFRSIELICGPSTPTPQISVTPSGNHDFGNQLVGSTSTPETFTIANTGNADLTLGTIALSGTNADQFSITQAGSSTITQGNTTTFTVSFSPTSLGSKTATVTIPNNDEEYTFTVTGTGSYAASSDIVTNTGFDYKNNILYANYQIPTITSTSNSEGVFQFAVRDGGGDNDGDDKPTTLTDIAFNYTGSANTIRAAALFNGNAHIANGVVTANGISFSGLNIVAPDNDSSPNITLRVSFTETVTDNQKLVFTVASATADASGSVFAQANAGGAFSDNNENDKNRIEVVADRLAFATQPSGASVNTNLATFVIAGVDQFGNTDADATNTITLTTSGTGMTASPSYTMSNGLASVSDVEFNAVQTGITLTATTTGLASGNTVTSAPFDISDLATGTYRTTSNGTWPSGATPATWERLTAGGWTNATPGANTTDLLIIRHTITTNAAFSATGGVGTKMIVENGGTFNAGHNSTFGTLTVQNGGVFSVNNPAVTVTTDGNLTVENGGRLIFNSSTLDSEDGLFRGTENFHPESILEIKNWHFNAGSGPQNLIQSNPTYYVTPNSAGYHFGHIEVNAPSMSSTLGVIQHTLSGSTVNLCNDFRVISNANNIILVNSGTSTVIGGNLLVNTAPSSQFSFSSNTSSNATHTVKGDIVIESGIVDLNQTSSNNGGNVVVQLQGNLVVNSGTLKNTDSGDVNTMLNFTGNGTEQTVSTASESSITNIPFNINSGAIVKIINHDFKLGNSSKLTVKTGGTLDFGFNGSTALNVAGYGNTGTGFTSEQGSYLKITSPQGIVSTSGSVGNIQVNTAPVINTLGTFHYIGKQNQITGNGIGASSNGRAVIVEMDTDALVLTPSVSFGITSTSNSNINNNNGGILDIRKGRFVETETEYVTGSTGTLKMEEGTYYEVVKATEGASDYIPRISGTYELNGGEINLASTGNQTLRGGKSYFDLTFSQGGEKGISSATASIAGTVTIKDHTVLDVGNTTFGGTPTHLVMEDTAMFIVNGGGTKPNMGGSYTLASGTTIDFTGSSATQIRVAPDYANVIVSGTNISAGTTDAAGLSFQNGGSFTVKNGATFKVNNPAGFTGSNLAAIKNADDLAAITLEPDSTIEYNGSGAQTITNGTVNLPNDANYQNLLISGTGTKTAAPGHLTVNGDLEIQGGTLRIEDSADEAASNVLFTNANLSVSEPGELVLGNNAQLMQTNTTVNIGEMSLERIFTLSTDRQQYNFVISPVSGQEIKTIYPNAPFVIELDESSNWFMDAGQGVYSPGKGYAIKEPTSAVSGATVRATMKGGFVNGNVNYTLSRTPDAGGEIYGSNLVGNPYPSALDLSLFYAENSDKIGGSAWFWDNRGNEIYNQQGSTYGGSNYAVYNFVNGTGLAASGASASGTSRKPTAYVRPATAFIVEANEDADGQTLLFTNAMRTTEFGPSFFGKANTTKDRYWLNLKTPAGLNVQTAVVYFPAGNNELWLDDSEARYSSDDFYSLVNDNQLSIQGKASFNVKDRVPLGVRLFADGVYVISIEDVEGVFAEGQIIYLRDKKTKMIYNLSENPYKFGAMAGEYNDRFEILYRKVILDELSATVFGKISLEKVNRNIEVKSTLDKIQKVEVYNLSGRLIYEQNQIQSLEYYLPLEQFGKQIIIVRTVSEKGEVVSKKFITK